MELLTRDEFREAVFKRDGYKCVHCGNQGQDAHHIMERRLWPDGGYYLDNGATLCGPCHIRAEQTHITPFQLRVQAGIQRVILPPHLYADAEYDKWGNVYIAIDRRMPGELFDDPSVQKILQPVLQEFANRIKYPRTYHLPWSPGLTSDDRVMTDLSGLEGQEVVITLKMDGEQTTIYSDGYCHARSLDSGSHESRNWVKALAARVGPQLPKGWRICGENLWAKHSIFYDKLPSYFLMFSIWDGLKCLSWQETEEWARLLDLHTVQRLDAFRRIMFGPQVESDFAFISKSLGHEGYVVRVAGEFHYREFRHKVGKYVRANHVHTHGHWMREQATKNRLKDDR
jgi:hypothetical protein